MELVKDQIKLKRKSDDLLDVNEGKEIVKKLFAVLSEHPTGYFLVANQIGIPKRVGVLNVRKPLFFINPKIIKQDKEFNAVESNLSFPNKLFGTVRYKIVALNADNFEKTIIFGSDLDEYKPTDTIIMESVFVQTMVDMMDGILPQDRVPIFQQTIQIVKDGRTKTIKSKKFNRYKNLGWKIKN